MATVAELEAALAKAKAEAKKQEQVDRFRNNPKNIDRMVFLIQRRLRDADELTALFRKGGYSDEEILEFSREVHGVGDEDTSLNDTDEVPQV